MGVIGVDAHQLREPGEVRAVGLLEAADHVGHTGGYEEILLLEPQGAARLGGIVGIEDAGDGLDVVPVLHGPGIISPVKGRQIQPLHHRLRAPELEHVDGLAAVAHDGDLIGHRQDGLGPLDGKPGLPVFSHGLLHIAAELDLHGVVRLFLLPGIAVLQPGIGLLGLVAADDPLAEQAEPVPDAHTHAGNAEIGHGIQKAGGQAAKAAVAQAGIPLAFAQRIQADPQILQALLDDILQLQVDQIVPQEAADQELHGEIVDLLLLLSCMALGGLGSDLSRGVGDQMDQQLVFLHCGALGHGLGEGLQGLGLICYLKIFFSCEKHKFSPLDIQDMGVRMYYF